MLIIFNYVFNCFYNQCLFGRIILLIQYEDNENFVLQAFHINI